MDAWNDRNKRRENKETRRKTRDRVCGIHLANDSSTPSLSAVGIEPRFVGDNRNHRWGCGEFANTARGVVAAD